jgi:hypothetical protein
VITPKWPHLLAAGALGFIGRAASHTASLPRPEISPLWLLALGAFPVLFYVGTTGWSLKIALADGENR